MELIFRGLFESNFNLYVHASVNLIEIRHMQCSNLSLALATYLIDQNYESSAMAVWLKLVFLALSSFKELMAAALVRSMVEPVVLVPPTNLLSFH